MPLHAARVVREGTDVTVAAYGPMVKTCLEAADRRRRGGPSTRGHRPALAVAARHGDAVARRSRRPAGWSSCTRRRSFLGLGAEIAARVTEQCFYSLEAPVLRVGGFDTPYPPSRVEEEYLPDLDRVLDAVDRSLAF